MKTQRKQRIYMTKTRKNYKAMAYTVMATTGVATIFLCGMLYGENNIEPIVYTEIMAKHTTERVYLPPTQDEIVNEIIDQARKSGVSVADSLRIGECESNYNSFARSSKSTSKGVYQFIDKTWKNYCTGNVYDYKDNIACFMKQYPKHKDWWECK